MRLRCCSLCVCIAFVGVAAAGKVYPPADAMRTVHIGVRLKDHAGAASSDICVVANHLPSTGGTVGAGKSYHACGKTNDQGRAALELALPSDVTRVTISAALGGRCCGPEDVERGQRFLKSNYIEPWYSVSIERDRNDYELEIAALDSYSVRGSVQINGPDGFFGNVAVGDHIQQSCVTKASGHISIDGVPRDRVSYLFVNEFHRNRLTAVPLTPPTKETEEVDIGVVNVLPDIEGIPIALELDKRHEIRNQGKVMYKTVCLIRADGTDLYTFYVHTDGKARISSKDGRLARVPPGIYYVSPGTPGGWEKCVSGLYRAVKEGKQAALDTEGVPKIEVKADAQSQSFLVDCVAAEAAIAKVVGYE